MRKLSLFSDYILLLIIFFILFFIIIVYKFKYNKNKYLIDTFQGIDQSGAPQSLNANLIITGTNDEITNLNTYSQRITNLEGRVTTLEQKIQSFQNAMNKTTS